MNFVQSIFFLPIRFLNAADNEVAIHDAHALSCKTIASFFGFDVVKVPCDGNCIFHACIHHLHNNCVGYESWSHVSDQGLFAGESAMILQGSCGVRTGVMRGSYWGHAGFVQGSCGVRTGVMRGRYRGYAGLLLERFF
jgi:hypothetical protein